MLTATADCISVPESHGQQMLARWLEAAGLPDDAWPLDTDDAGVVLRAGGYRCDGQELRRLASIGQVPAIEQWDARDLMAAASALEGRRQWVLTPCVHDPKKTAEWRGFEQMLIAGDQGRSVMRRAFSEFDVRLAFVLLVESDNRQMRETLFTTLAALFACEGIYI
ncbi:hypothetical protein BH11PLA2_BH11PLA2_45870 [soil metagenome]